MVKAYYSLIKASSLKFPSCRMEPRYYEPLEKPKTVEIGQKWWLATDMLYQRPFCVIDIKPIGFPWHDRNEPDVLCACFRKNTVQPCIDLLDDPVWHFVGMINERWIKKAKD